MDRKGSIAKIAHNLKMRKARQKHCKEDMIATCFAFGGMVGIVALILIGTHTVIAIGVLLAVAAMGLFSMGILAFFQGKRMKQCINMIDNGTKSIDEICAALNIPYNKIISVLYNMIADGVFDNISIDASKREIIRKNNNISSTNYGQNEEMKAPKNCPSCGAPNSAEAVQSGKCEYCGAQL